MRVDLTKTDHRLMRRFMGDEGFQIYARHNGMLARQGETRHALAPPLDTTAVEPQ